MGLIRNIRKGFMFLNRPQALAPEDLALLGGYLTPGERDLFLQMDEGDQAHSLRVTRTCAQALANYPELNERLMMKAALLHDVGKIDGHLGLVFRTFWVMGHRLLPCLLEWVARRSASAPRGSLRGKMHTQLFHAEIGAEMLAKLGTEEEVCRLIAATGRRREPDDPLDIKLLLAADADRVMTR